MLHMSITISIISAGAHQILDIETWKNFSEK